VSILRNDLLIAADSVTNAMQNLVKELHSDTETASNYNSGMSDNDDENDCMDYGQRQQDMMRMLTNRTHQNHMSIQQHQLMQHHHHLQSPPPPPTQNMYTSLSANTTPLFQRKSMNGSLLTNNTQATITSTSANNTPLHNRYNNTNSSSFNGNTATTNNHVNDFTMYAEVNSKTSNGYNNSSSLNSNPVTNEDANYATMSKVNIIKQIAKTFKVRRFDLH
jgi:hypothetical protein